MVSETRKAGMRRNLIIYGAKSPLVAEIEETCLRADVELQAVVSLGGTSRALTSDKVVQAEDVGSMSDCVDFIPCAFAPKRRRELVEDAKSRGLKLASALIDPTSIVARSTRFATGVYVNAGAVIGAVSMVRQGAFINRTASVGHHCVIGAYASLGPGCVLASNVVIEDDVIVGAGAVIMPDIHIGQGAVISAGATVSRNVPDGALVTGERAKVIADGARRIALRRGDKE